MNNQGRVKMCYPRAHVLLFERKVWAHIQFCRECSIFSEALRHLGKMGIF